MLILDIAAAVQEPESLTVQGGGLSFSPGFTAPMTPSMSRAPCGLGSPLHSQHRQRSLEGPAGERADGTRHISCKLRWPHIGASTHGRYGRTSPERNLVFGLLALQNGLIDQDQLVAAFRVWSRDKSRQIADYLVERGDLDADQRDAVAVMLRLHEKKHGGNAEKSLAAFPPDDRPARAWPRSAIAKSRPL